MALDPQVEQMLISAGIATPTLKQEVADKIEATLIELEGKLNAVRDEPLALIRPEIDYDLKGHVAGRANAQHIRINTQLLYANKETYLAQTLPHEVCHVAQRQLYPQSKSHGYEWSRLMILLGLVPDRCHTYETTAARKRSKPFTVYCGCNEHKVTATIYGRMLAGKRYKCRTCDWQLRLED